MKVIIFILIILASLSLNAQTKVGAEKCKPCHTSKGQQYQKWKNTNHSKAFEVLKSEEALKIAKEKNIIDPSSEQQCLKCHVTNKTFINEGVSCESCHGAGSVYKTMMKNKFACLDNGLIEPLEKVCITCHNNESPTFKSFNYEDYKLKIIHKN